MLVAASDDADGEVGFDRKANLALGRKASVRTDRSDHPVVEKRVRESHRDEDQDHSDGNEDNAAHRESVTVVGTGDIPATGTGDSGLGTNERGLWRVTFPATGYEVSVIDAGNVVGRGRAIVRGGETTRITIVVDH
jgi:hypothetical protein